MNQLIKLLKLASTYVLAILNKIYLKIVYGNKIELNGLQHIRRGAKIVIQNGKIHLNRGFIMQKGAYLSAVGGGRISIGEGVFINRNTTVVCRERISIGENTLLGPNCLIYDHDHKFTAKGIVPGEYKTGAVEIGNNCWIGAGVIILRNTKIGDNCVIGAGCVVKGNVPDKSLVTSPREMIINPIHE